jgi:hypothetical protein
MGSSMISEGAAMVRRVPPVMRMSSFCTDPSSKAFGPNEEPCGRDRRVSTSNLASLWQDHREATNS